MPVKRSAIFEERQSSIYCVELEKRRNSRQREPSSENVKEEEHAKSRIGILVSKDIISKISGDFFEIKKTSEIKDKVASKFDMTEISNFVERRPNAE